MRVQFSCVQRGRNNHFHPTCRVLLLFLFIALASARDRSYPYIPANCKGNELTLFLSGQQTVVVSLPLPASFECVGFSSDGKSVFATSHEHPTDLQRIEFNPTHISPACSNVSMQGNPSPDGKWTAELNVREKLVLVETGDASHTQALGRGGIMKPAWSPDSRYLLLERWQWRCGINFDVEVPETLEMLDIMNRKRSVVKSSRCKVQFGVNGFVDGNVVREYLCVAH